jgi:parallel beta-helix repeat protein
MSEMKKKFLTIYCLLCTVFLIGFEISVTAASELHVHNIDTDLNYATIQEAINAPETVNGHAILVDAGTYYENLVINKSISIIGENRQTTIIDGRTGFPWVETVIYVTANEVTLAGFTLRGSKPYCQSLGIRITSNRNNISNNLMIHNRKGIWLLRSFHNLISNNDFLSIDDEALWLTGSFNNTIVGNTFSNGYCGILLEDSRKNKIFHNNFINNTKHARSQSPTNINIWHDAHPSGGNYWSDHTHVDLDYDGIGDSPHTLSPLPTQEQSDNYPLMGMFSSFKATSDHCIQTVCNSTISDFQFDSGAIRFNVTAKEDTTGFCRVCIPKALLNNTYRVFVNDTEVPHTLLSFSKSTHSYLYFTYPNSTQEVVIIPEFPLFTILLFFLIATLFVALIKRWQGDIRTSPKKEILGKNSKGTYV